MSKFKIALSGDFRKANGEPAFPMFDLGPLADDPDVELDYVDPVDGVMPSAALAGHDALILLMPRFAAESVPDDGRLAIVARFGVGYDNVDLDVCNANGISAVITPDGVRRPVAVAVITMMLALSGKLMVKDRITRQGPDGWALRNRHMGVGIVGKTLGVLGMGNIGAETFRMARPFDMAYIAHDPYVDPAAADGLGVRLVGIEELFATSDFLSVSTPLNAETRGIVSAERIAMMKPTAYLINTARGPVVDQAAITAALMEKRIAGAGLDVFTDEPSAADDPLFELDNVITTPHALCWTDQCFAGIGAADVRAVLDVKAGRVPRGIVNAEIEGDRAWQAKLADYGSRFGG